MVGFAINSRHSDQRNVWKFFFCPLKGATVKSSLGAWTAGGVTRSAITGPGGGDGVVRTAVTGEYGGARLDLVVVLDTVNKILGLGHSGFLRSRSSPVLSGCSSMYLCTYRTLILGSYC